MVAGRILGIGPILAGLLFAVAATISAPAAAQGVQTGPSGFPLPRFVSMKSHPVNVRLGPSRDHDVAWTFTRAGIPVEVTQEFDIWFRIRDSEGQEGWVQKSFVTGRRTALISPWENAGPVAMRRRPDTDVVVARLEPNVLVEVTQCDGKWCRIAVERFTGWVEQSRLWGVYPAEKYPND